MPSYSRVFTNTIAPEFKLKFSHYAFYYLTASHVLVGSLFLVNLGICWVTLLICLALLLGFCGQINRYYGEHALQTILTNGQAWIFTQRNGHSVCTNHVQVAWLSPRLVVVRVFEKTAKKRLYFVIWADALGATDWRALRRQLKWSAENPADLAMIAIL